MTLEEALEQIRLVQSRTEDADTLRQQLAGMEKAIVQSSRENRSLEKRIVELPDATRAAPVPPSSIPSPTSAEILQQIEDKFFVAGQMDAQGTAAEKWHVGDGGPLRTLSKRLLTEAREQLAGLVSPVPPRDVVLFEALCAARDALVGFQKQAGYLPEQGGYSTRMTEPEQQLAQAVASIDQIIADTRGVSCAAQP
jgi:hypothetical protein